MRTLIVEDDFTSRLILQDILSAYGPVHIAVNGQEAVEAVRAAMEIKQHYNLICMDIMMQGMDGQQALREIRALEETQSNYAPNGEKIIKGAKIIMTSALDDMPNKISAFSGLCDDYLVKPIHKERLLYVIQSMKLIP
jgi:two-component system, chemotaxis family, chemotaxis protein CheY